MDEAAYREALKSSPLRSCPFEKTVLSNCADCSRAEKRNIAERETVSCNSVDAFDRCTSLRDLLRHNFTFALGKAHIDGPLPHAQEMRMQCGGLKGLQFALDGNDDICDVFALVAMSQQQFGELTDFPYAEIVRFANTHYKAR
jgi:hypothetical protein